MTRFRLLLLVAAVLLPLAGCEWAKGVIGKIGGPKNKEPLPPVQSEQLVTYLNERAARLQSLKYDDVRMSVSAKEIPVPVSLTGSLAATQPRNFRMAVSGKIRGKVDIGSNRDQFWVYVDGAGPQPMYVYASHSDFEEGKAQLPGGLPFEPDWVMQALGMTTFPASNQYKALQPDQRNRTYTLSWPATTPSGTSVVKEIIFDGDPATGNRPQVKKHIIRDTKGKVICFAEIKQAKTVQLAQTDPRTGLPLAVQYPTLVVLRWEEQKFEMELELRNGQINRSWPEADAQRLFNRPNREGAVNLAEYTFPSK